MGLSAEQYVYWPGFWSDIEGTRSKCPNCQKIAPSQAKLPTVEPLVPNYPFKHICVDYMSLNGCQFGVFMDWYTGWPLVIMGTAGFDLTKFLAKLCVDYRCRSAAPQLGAEPHCQGGGGHDGGLCIHHRIKSVANTCTNARAELGDKTVKRMVMDIVSATGILERAMVLCFS
jgi:hypothetical protein